MKNPVQKLMIVLASACLSLPISAPLQAQTDTDAHHSHGHGHDEHAAAGLTLDQGKKWQTDAPLRKGMQSIHAAVMSAAPAFHHNTFTQQDADNLARHINEQVTYMVNNCKLEPKADATLHVLIGDLLTGADALTKTPSSNQGLPRMVKVLQVYPDYFDHQGWVMVPVE